MSSPAHLAPLLGRRIVKKPALSAQYLSARSFGAGLNALPATVVALTHSHAASAAPKKKRELLFPLPRPGHIEAICADGMSLANTTSRQDCEHAIVGMLDKLYNTALRLTRNPADAEDLVAESVAKALAGLDSLKDHGCLRGWVFRILHNTHTSLCRKRNTQREVSWNQTTDDDEEADFWLFDHLHQPFLLWWGNPEQAFLDNVLREDIERALDKLPQTYRLVVILADIEELTYEEIAAALQVPIGTVRSRLSRGRSMLQKTLWRQAKDVGLKAHGGSAKPGKTG